MSARIYIGHLNSRVQERDIEHFFRGYGKIRDILLKNGFGFVEFDDRRDADDAVYDLNGKELQGDRVLLDFSKPRGDSGGRAGGPGGGGRVSSYGGGGGGRGPPRRESRYGRPQSTRHRMIVENLSTRVSWQDLKDHVRKIGIEPTYAEAHKKNPNEGLVCFSNQSDLRKCIEKLNGMDINGRKLNLVDDTEGDDRSRSRSPRNDKRKRSRSRSSGSGRSRSRSRSPRRRSRSKSASRSRSRSPSPVPKKAKKEEARSRSRSASPAAASDDGK